MPRDLLAEQGVTPPTGRDLLAGQMQVQPSYAGVYRPTTLPGRAAADIMAGIAQFGHRLMGAPHRIAGQLAGWGVVSPETAARIPAPTRDIDYGRALGVEKPTAADTITQSLSQYLPAALLGGGTIPGITAAGAAFGATQGENPALDALAGAGINLTTAGMAHGLQKGLPSVTKALSKYAAPGLAKKIGGAAEMFKDLKSAAAFDKAKANFDVYQQAENQAWDNLTQHAGEVDAKGVGFNDEAYNKALGNKLAQYTKEAEQSGLARKNADSMALLNDYMKDPHGTFTDVIQHNRALNADFQNEITPGKSLPFSTVNYAKSNLKNAIQQNLTDKQLQDTLGLSWQRANQATVNKNSMFNYITSPQGKEQPSAFMRFYRGEKEYDDPSAFVKQYIPKTGTEGIGKMQQFANMVGEEDFAKQALKSNIFDKAYDEGGFKPQQFLSKYNSLSKEQRDYLFPKDQQNMINTLSKILRENPGALGAKRILGMGLYHSIPALIGAGIGHHYGTSYLGGALAGLGTARGGEALLRALYSTPGLQQSVIRALSREPGRIAPNLGRLLSSRFMGGITLPPVMGAIQRGQ